MSSTDADVIASLLEAMQHGDRTALTALFPLVYDELTVLAHRQRRAWRADLTLNTTAVVHEAYLKLAGQRQLPSESRGHFFAVAAKAMRHILCNHARDRRAMKRGGGTPHVGLELLGGAAIGIDDEEHRADELAALDDALDRLERVAGRAARVVECRFFGGMSVEETAEALGTSTRTVKRDWTFARAWLRREMCARGDGSEGHGPWKTTA